MFPKYETLRTAMDGDALTVWLNRPHVRNAMNRRMCEELVALFGLLCLERQIRVVTVRAEGTVFCAGVDLRELASQDAQRVLARRNRGLDAFLAIERAPQPVVCAVQGPAIGAGCEIAGACDFIIASDQAFFQWPEALRGNVGATQRLPRAVGRPMAKELLFTSRKITAEDARVIGFVNKVVPAGSFEDVLYEYARDIASNSPTAVRLIKQAIDLGETLDRNTAVNLERQLIEQCMLNDEWREGIAAFTLKNQ